jgi:hypothetical protein
MNKKLEKSIQKFAKFTLDTTPKAGYKAGRGRKK